MIYKFKFLNKKQFIFDNNHKNKKYNHLKNKKIKNLKKNNLKIFRK